MLSIQDSGLVFFQVVRLPPLVYKDLFGDQVQLLCRNTGTTGQWNSITVK
jgi:hypothetical protein